MKSFIVEVTTADRENTAIRHAVVAENSVAAILRVLTATNMITMRVAVGAEWIDRYAPADRAAQAWRALLTAEEVQP